MRPTKGQWRPGMPQDVSALLLYGFTLLVWVRGIDYFTGDRADVTTSLSVVEAAMSLQWWGAFFIIGAALTTAGIAVKQDLLIIYGSLLNMALYGGLTWGLLLKMVERGWPWDGYRTPLQFLMLAVVWGGVAYGTQVMAKARQPNEEK